MEGTSETRGLDSSPSTNEESPRIGTSETRGLDSSLSTNEERSRTGTSETRGPPLFSLAILRKATSDDIDSMDKSELSRRVYAGVLLVDNEGQVQAQTGEDQGPRYTHKYRVDEVLNKNCWTVLATVLTIAWIDDSRYWKWIEEDESSYQGVEKVKAARLKHVCWLDIIGKCKSIMLSPKTAYEVKILLKMKPKSYGWEVPVNLSLTLPDGTKQGRMERLDRLQKGEWHKISIGKFVTTPKTVGEISFSLAQKDGRWKSGLVVKGVEFTPCEE